MKVCGCWLAVAIAIAGTAAEAVTSWSPVHAKVDEVVTDTTVVPPSHPSVIPLATPIPFKNFRYPHVNTNEDVTFIADDISRTHQHGIYRSFSASQKLQPLVVKGLPVGARGALQFELMTGIHMDGDDFAFTAQLSNGDWGIFHWANGIITTVATGARLSRWEDYGSYPADPRTAPSALIEQTILPGQDSPVSSVGYSDVKNGRVLYQARDRAGTVLALYDVKTKTQQVLLRTGMPIPGHAGEQFRYLTPQNWLGEHSVIFHASRLNRPDHLQKPWHWFEDFRNANAPTRANGDMGVYGWFGIDWNDPNAFNLTNLVTVADWATPVSIDGGNFTYFGSAPVAGDLVAFLGIAHKRTGESAGIYCTTVQANESHSTRTFQSIVDTDTEIGVLFKGPFTGFGKWVEVFDDSVLFIAYAGTHKEYTGVFLYKPKLDALFLLCDNRRPIDGKQARTFEVSPKFMVRNRFAITVSFKDGTAGVYLATIPPRFFKRMTAGR